MKIAFDMDGVLRYSHLGLLRACADNNRNYEPYKLEMHMMHPLINPSMFATEDDELYCVTNCMTEYSVEQKKRWVEFWFGNKVKILPVMGQKKTKGGADWGYDYCIPVAKTKVRVMLELGIDLYFDDDPTIIKVMRKLTDKITFVKYGPWFEEYFPEGASKDVDLDKLCLDCEGDCECHEENCC